MKLRSTLLGIILIVVLSACFSVAKVENSLLWKVSGNGLDKPSYLFGTHHLVPISFLDEIVGLDEAFGSVEQVVGELDMSKMESMQMAIMQKAIMPKEYNYVDMLSEDDYKLLTSQVEEVIGLDFAMLERMKPAMINNLLMITLYQKYYPSMENGVGIDQSFQDKAREKGLSVKGLEDADDQIFLLLESQSMERQAELLMCSIKHTELLKEQMDRLQDAYTTQNLGAITDLYNDDSDDSPCPSTDEEKNLMNEARNIKWLQKLPQMMKEKPSFVAVGCLHLVGDEGLIEGLRQAGYKVEAVK